MEKEPIQVTPSWGNDKWSDPDAGIQRTAPTGSDAPTCSGSSFEWITPKDRRWAEWHAWDEKILVMTSDGPMVVRVPENSYPEYVGLDGDDEIAEPDEWTAWSRIPRLQNDQVEARD